MAIKLKTEFSEIFELSFAFANTSQESEETLIFMDRVDRTYDLHLAWLEAVVHPDEKRGCSHKITNFKDAKRDGSVFESMIEKYGIPNKPFPHCTRELKLNPMRSYLRSIGWVGGTYHSAVGIRCDEANRLDANGHKHGICYPLAHWFPMSKGEINDWWVDQPFDLQLPDYRGNCVWCWKKHTPKLITIIKESPEVFDFPARMEAENGRCGGNADPEHRRKFFRNGLSTMDLFKIAELGGHYRMEDSDENSGCSESCEAFLAPEAQYLLSLCVD